MKITKFLLLGIIVVSGTIVNAQELEQAKLDTVFLLGMKKLVVEVRYVSSASVLYIDPETDEQSTFKRKQIQKIHYSNGRVEVFNKPVFSMVEEGDWKSVVVTHKKSEVQGLHELGKVEGKSSAGSRNAKAAKKTATIRMQKRAANMGAIMVLVTKEEAIGGFGEEPTYNIKGIAYGFEPPKKD